MLAVQISRHGGPDELVPADLPDPVPAAGQVLVRNSWRGNRVSGLSLMRSGVRVRV